MYNDTILKFDAIEARLFCSCLFLMLLIQKNTLDSESLAVSGLWACHHRRPIKRFFFNEMMKMIDEIMYSNDLENVYIVTVKIEC